MQGWVLLLVSWLEWDWEPRIFLLTLSELVGLSAQNQWLLWLLVSRHISQTEVARVLGDTRWHLNGLNRGLGLMMWITDVVVSGSIGRLSRRGCWGLLGLLVGLDALLSLQDLRTRVPLVWPRFYIKLALIPVQRLSLRRFLLNDSERSTPTVLTAVPIQSDNRGGWNFILFLFIFRSWRLIRYGRFLITERCVTLLVCWNFGSYGIAFLSACHRRIDITWAWGRHVTGILYTDRRMRLGLVMSTWAYLRIRVL